MPPMKIFFVRLCLTFIFLGCQEHQTSDLIEMKRRHHESMAKELNNKAEEMLDSDPDSALTLLDSALKFNPDDYILYFNLGHVYISKKEYVKTIDIYKQMLIKKPDFTQGIIFLGMLYEKTGKPDTAKLQYQRAIDICNIHIKNSDNGQNQDKIHRIFALYLLDSATARPQLENLIKENPQNGILKILKKSTRLQVINGFLPD